MKTTLATLGAAGLLLSSWASAAQYTYNQTYADIDLSLLGLESDVADAELRGSFAGEDLNLDGFLSLGELTAFNGEFVLGLVDQLVLVSFGQSDVADFNYDIDTMPTRLDGEEERLEIDNLDVLGLISTDVMVNTGGQVDCSAGPVCGSLVQTNFLNMVLLDAGTSNPFVISRVTAPDGEVPLPAAAALFGPALGGLGYLNRRRKRRAAA